MCIELSPWGPSVSGLMSISKDERERAIFRSRRMYQTDQESNRATVEERGRVEGRVEGRAERDIEIARNLLAMSLPLDQIMKATGLTRDEIEGLR